MKRWKRILLGLVIVLVLLGVGLGVAWRFWLPRHAPALVASRLAAAYGGAVEIGAVEIGATSSSVQDLKLFEAGEKSVPWATVQDATADLSLTAVVQGETMPRHLTLTGAEVLLRFNKDGKLLTKLPSTKGETHTLPDVHVENSRLILRQEGRPEMVLAGIGFELRPEGEKLTLTGAVEDAAWGHWSLEGTANRQQETASATLKTDNVHVTMALLKNLPLIPASTWQEVQVEDDTPVQVAVHTAPKEGVHYEIDLEPRSARVQVPSIDLSAQQAHGKVIVKDGLIQLRDVAGQAVGGTLELPRADLDFLHDPSKMAFEIHVNNLEMRQLPRSWSLPPQIEGRLTGQANLLVTLVNGHAQTSGQGHGTINQARIAGEPAEPIQLELNAGQGGYRFSARRDSPFPGRGTALASGGWKPPVSRSKETRGFHPPLALALALALQAPPAPATPPAAPRTLEVNLGMDNLDLAELVKRLNLKLPYPVTGRLTFHVKAVLPLDTPAEPKTYQMDGTAELPQLSIAGLNMEQVKARISYRDGVLQLEELSGQVAGASLAKGTSVTGTFGGKARVEVIPQGQMTANLTLKNIPLAQVLSLVPGAAEQAEGRFSAQLDTRLPVAQLKDVRTWEVSGRLTTDRVQAFGLTLTGAATTMLLQKGVFAVTDLHGQVDQNPLTGTGSLELSAPYHFQGKADVSRFDLAALNQLAPQVRLPVKVAGILKVSFDGHGTLSPLNVISTGSIQADDLQVKGLRVNHFQVGWDSTGDRLTLKNLGGVLYGGKLSGQGVVPLQPNVAGDVEVTLRNFDLGALARDVPSLPVRLAGQAGGTIHAAFPPVKSGQERAVTARVDLQAPQLQVQGIPAEGLSGTVDYRQGVVDYQLKGATLGGTFDVNGQVPLTQPKTSPPPGQEGHLHLHGLQLGRLGPTLSSETLGALHGSFDLDLTFRQKALNVLPVGAGQFALHRLRWGEAELAPNLQGTVQLTEQELRLTDLKGIVAGGTPGGTIALDLKEWGQGAFHLTLLDAEAAQLLAPWPALSSQVQGTLVATLRGRLGREWWGGGQVVLSNGKVFEVNIPEWRMPLDFSYFPGDRRGEVDIRDTTAELARGRITGNATFIWGLDNRLEGQFQFSTVDMQTLLRSFTTSTQIGSGLLSGRLDFGGSNIQSVNDLTATLNATLRDAQALSYPVLEQMIPFIALGQGTGAYFNSGSVRGRLAGGIFRLEEASFQGNLVRLYVEGNITVEGGLNLDVTASTGQLSPNPLLLQRLGLALPLAGPIP
ncbi:MAG: hypothetical protein JO112_07995, partial [Planctomycetes bacterium]|nr:hypothetical protein [Planctomycetota bacterium]